MPGFGLIRYQEVWTVLGCHSIGQLDGRVSTGDNVAITSRPTGSISIPGDDCISVKSGLIRWLRIGTPSDGDCDT